MSSWVMLEGKAAASRLTATASATTTAVVRAAAAPVLNRRPGFIHAGSFMGPPP